MRSYSNNTSIRKSWKMSIKSVPQFCKYWLMEKQRVTTLVKWSSFYQKCRTKILKKKNRRKDFWGSSLDNQKNKSLKKEGICKIRKSILVSMRCMAEECSLMQRRVSFSKDGFKTTYLLKEDASKMNCTTKVHSK